MSNKIICICGGSGSGKSTLSLALSNRKRAVYISEDWYYLPFSDLDVESKKRKNFDAPDVLDIVALRQHLLLLKDNTSIVAPIYSFSLYDRIGSQEVYPSPFIILEGMYAYYFPKIKQLVDYSIYVKCPKAVRFQRILKRDVSERGRSEDWVYNQFIRDVQPMHEKYVQTQKEEVDLQVDGTLSMSFLTTFIEHKIRSIFPDF